MHDALERLAQPGRIRPGVGNLIVLALEGERPLAAEDLATDGNIFLGARQRLAERDGPMPQRKRLPDIICKVIAVIATQVGVRACICMMPVPALIFVVRASTQVIGVTASVP